MPPGPLALVPVRNGELNPAGIETVAAVGGVPMLVGQTSGAAAASLAGLVDAVVLVDTATLAPGRLARALAPHVAGHSRVVLPGTPDGRDLGARLAAELGWPYLGTAVSIADAESLVTRHHGELMARVQVGGPFVATLQPGITTVVATGAEVIATTSIDLDLDADPTVPDAVTVAVEGPDAETMDLAEAPRIVGGGAGLMGDDRTAEHVERLVGVGAAIGASMGATRVVTDAGWVPHARQIGTTGVVVDPDLYLAFGISGAVQHTAGLGHPRHVISVNTDPHCPMMAMADLAVVADANDTLDALAELLGVDSGPLAGDGS